MNRKNLETHFVDFVFEVDELFETMRDESIGTLSFFYMTVLHKTLEKMGLSTKTIETYGFLEWKVNSIEALEQVFSWHYHLLKSIILKNVLKGE